MLSYLIGGQTDDDRWAYIESAREAEIVSIEQIDNPARSGHQMRIIKLKRDNPIVKEILARKWFGELVSSPNTNTVDYTYCLPAFS